MAKYDIFISYRREGGYDTAKHLYDLLTRDGYKVSFDIDTLRNGDFDTSLLNRIDECKDFILIVDAHAFDRTLDPQFNPQNDWLRQELAYALKKGKNIIPIFLNGVNGFPENLPSDIKGVSKKNGPEYNRYYFNDFYNTLKNRFVTSKSSKNILRLIILIIFIIIIIVIALILNRESPIFPHTIFNNQTNNEKIDTINTNDDIQQITFLDDYSTIQIGDFVYEDKTFAHSLTNQKKCIGVVYDIMPPHWCSIVSLEDYGMGHRTTCKRIANDGNSYNVAGLKWRLPALGEWFDILNNLGGFKLELIPEGECNAGNYQFKSDPLKIVTKLEFLNLDKDKNYWSSTPDNYWGYDDDIDHSYWAISFPNNGAYCPDTGDAYFRYIADIDSEWR